MNNHETFGRKVIAILEDRIGWDDPAIIEIVNLAESMDLATWGDGEFLVTHGFGYLGGWRISGDVGS